MQAAICSFALICAFFNPVKAVISSHGSFLSQKGFTGGRASQNIQLTKCVSFEPGVKTRNMNFRWNLAKQITEAGEKELN